MPPAPHSTIACWNMIASAAAAAAKNGEHLTCAELLNEPGISESPCYYEGGAGLHSGVDAAIRYYESIGDYDTADMIRENLC